MNNASAPPKIGFNPNIHGARGFFCAMVFVFHVLNSKLATFEFMQDGFIEYFGLSLQFGVELFFGISGIVIMQTLSRSSGPGHFIWDRVARIYPVLWCCLAAITLMELFAPVRPLPAFGEWLAGFFAPPPFLNIHLIHPAAWSLGYEMTFYLLCALAVWLRGNSRYLEPILYIFAFCLLVLYPRGLLIPAGILIASGRLNATIFDRMSKRPLWLLLIFLLSWFWLVGQQPGDITVFNAEKDSIQTRVLIFPLLLCSALFGMLALQGIFHGRGDFSRLLRTPLMQWMGTISYSFYLWHPLVMAITKKGLHSIGVFDFVGNYSQLCLFILALPPSLLISHFSQKILESYVSHTIRKFGDAKIFRNLNGLAVVGRLKKSESVGP